MEHEEELKTQLMDLFRKLIFDQFKSSKIETLVKYQCRRFGISPIVNSELLDDGYKLVVDIRWHDNNGPHTWIFTTHVERIELETDNGRLVS